MRTMRTQKGGQNLSIGRPYVVTLCSHAYNKGAAAQQLTHREVALVADEHDGHVGVGVLARILQPAGQVVERLTPGIQVMTQIAR
jgi:hypothetical protein